MNSSFANLYLNTIERLAAEAALLRYIEQDLGQMEHYPEGGRPPVSFPCVLIDIEDTAFDEMGEQCQLGEGILQVRICQPTYSASNNLAPEEVRKTALNYYETEQQVHEALHGWAKDNFSKLVRVSAKTEKRNDEYRVRVLRYRFGMEDYSTAPTKITITRPDPTIVT